MKRTRLVIGIAALCSVLMPVIASAATIYLNMPPYMQDTQYVPYHYDATYDPNKTTYEPTNYQYYYMPPASFYESSPSWQPAPTTAIEYVRSHSLMTGYPSGSFGENKTVNRAEFAKIITTIYSRLVPPTYTMRLPFRDTSNSAWYTPSIVYVYGLGIMTGYSDNTFRPDRPVNFSEAAKALSMAYGLPAAGATTDAWYEGYVRTLAGQHAIPVSIKSLFQPLTRGDLADILYRLDSGDTSRSSLTFDDLALIGNYDGTSVRCFGMEKLQVTIGAQRNDPMPGDRITYDIHLRNCSGQNQFVDLTADIDSQTSFVSASDGGEWRGRAQVMWNDVGIRSDSEVTLTLTVDVSQRTVNGDRVDLSVYAVDRHGNNSTANNHVILGRGNNDSSFIPVRGPDRTKCFYDAYGQYSCINPPSSSQDLSLSIITDTVRPYPGDTMSTSINLSNTQDRDDWVTLTVYLDPLLTYDAASNFPDVVERHRVQWNLRIGAHSSMSVIVDARLSDDALAGEQVTISAAADGTYHSTDASAHVRVGG